MERAQVPKDGQAARGALMRAVEHGSANTSGDLRVRLQNDEPSTGALRRVARPSVVTAKSTTFRH